MELTASSVGLPPLLWDAFQNDLMPWLQAQSGLATPEQAAVSAALAVEPMSYMYAPHCLRDPVRSMLLRASIVGHRMASATTVVHVASNEVPVDIFTTEPASGPLYFAKTATADHTNALGTQNSWYYHVVLNGLVHPVTREPITGFGLYVVPPAADAVPAAEGAKIFDLDIEERAKLVVHLGGPMPLVPEDPSPVVTAIRFECFYRVPLERSFTVQVIGLPVTSFNYFWDLGAAALEDIVADDGSDDDGGLDDDDADSFFDDVMQQIM